MSVAAPRIRTLGDSVVLVELEPVIDPGVNARVLGLARAIARQRIAGVRDLVPAYTSLAVHVDPLQTSTDAIAARVRALAGDPTGDAPLVEAGEIVVPVRYGGADGPDLAAVAAWAGLSEAEVVSRHAGRSYRVFMIGFLPGFPYLGVVDESIAMPRLDAPRARVPAGSVGIAGRQTGIYPLESPGGWQLIGRCELALFDPQRDPPALFAPGARVRFEPARSFATRGGT